MSNPVIIWLAGILGWDTGPVVALVTVLVIFATGWLLVFIAVGLPNMLANNYRNAGPIGRVFFGILLLGAIVLAFFANVLFGILAIVAFISLAGEAKEWWKK